MKKILLAAAAVLTMLSGTARASDDQIRAFEREFSAHLLSPSAVNASVLQIDRQYPLSAEKKQIVRNGISRMIGSIEPDIFRHMRNSGAYSEPDKEKFKTKVSGSLAAAYKSTFERGIAYAPPQLLRGFHQTIGSLASQTTPERCVRFMRGTANANERNQILYSDVSVQALEQYMKVTTRILAIGNENLGKNPPPPVSQRELEMYSEKLATQLQKEFERLSQEDLFLIANIDANPPVLNSSAECRGLLLMNHLLGKLPPNKENNRFIRDSLRSGFAGPAF